MCLDPSELYSRYRTPSHCHFSCTFATVTFSHLTFLVKVFSLIFIFEVHNFSNHYNDFEKILILHFFFSLSLCFPATFLWVTTNLTTNSCTYDKISGSLHPLNIIRKDEQVWRYFKGDHIEWCRFQSKIID